MTKIIAVTGPGLAGKSSFSKTLMAVLTSMGYSANKIIRATTRDLIRPEFDEGAEFEEYSRSEMVEAIGNGDVVGAYGYANNGYGIVENTINGEADHNVVAIRAPIGIRNLRKDTEFDVVTTILYLGLRDVHERVLKQLQNVDVEGLRSAGERLSDTKRELPGYLEMMLEEENRYVLFNPNVSVGQSAEIMTYQKPITHLAHRLVDALEFEQQSPSDSDNQTLRELYIEKVAYKLFGVKSIELAEEGQRLKIDDAVISEYSGRSMKSEEELRALIPTLRAIRNGYGISSAFITHTTDEETKRHLLNLIEMQVGTPQYRFESLTQDVKSPMSLTHVLDGYTNPWISFSLAYDPPQLHPRHARTHNLVLESTDVKDTDSIKLMEPDDAERNLFLKPDLVRLTNLPYTLFD